MIETSMYISHIDIVTCICRNIFNIETESKFSYVPIAVYLYVELILAILAVHSHPYELLE